MPARSDLRDRLLAERVRFVASSAAAQAEADLARELRGVLADLEPQCLGLYWPRRGEFNAPAALAALAGPGKSLRALPFARRTPPELHYRLWNGEAPTLNDECAIPTSAGDPVVPRRRAGALVSATRRQDSGSATAAATSTAGSRRIRASVRSASRGRWLISTTPSSRRRRTTSRWRWSSPSADPFDMPRRTRP
jgi:hypothetical protein